MKVQTESDNHIYWVDRALGYSKVNQEELKGIQHRNWASFLDSEIQNRYPDCERSDIKIADIGAGPGFISIILTELGYCVTAIDFAATMLEEARMNAGKLSDQILFVQADACELPFADGEYDVVFSRNLTWNLNDPGYAYREWLRLLKSEGLMLVFDANWYHYLIDDEKRLAYEADREQVAKAQIEDYNIGENFDQMEEIARTLPMTRRERPAWDVEFLKTQGQHRVTVQENIGSLLYSDQEKLNYQSTPLFMIKLVKERNQI